MKAMILAAGLGTRLRPYSLHTPKPLFTINDRPVLEIIIRKLQKAGCDAVVINTHHLHDRIEAFLAARTFDLPVKTRHEAEILGTGGGIRNVADFWEHDTLLVINADVVTDIDLGRVCAFHQTHSYPVTMVMHDHARFNSVRVDSKDFIAGFKNLQNTARNRLRAFTGIHVLDRRVLDFLPSRGPAHIINAYERMIEAGESIKAYIARGHRWYDIGTPESYAKAAYEHMAPLAFEAAFGVRPTDAIHRQALQGDGSDRRWYRLSSGGQSLIMVDHGIRTATDRQEVDAYIDIGRHLHATGIAIPRIQSFDRCAGLVFLQDLGDIHFQSSIEGKTEEDIHRNYARVIDQWSRMAAQGGKTFDTRWTCQTPTYDRQVVLNNECRYFLEAFVQGYMGWEVPYEDLRREFEELADRIAQWGIQGFMHRDFQSRNIMVQEDQFYFIDFQGGRLGPMQYDLASLLIDPYAELSRSLQTELLTYAADILHRYHGVDPDRFIKGYAPCALSRNLQILGAFAFLSQTKGKTQFETYIPRAVRNLSRNLACLKGLSLPKLDKLAQKIMRKVGTC